MEISLVTQALGAMKNTQSVLNPYQIEFLQNLFVGSCFFIDESFWIFAQNTNVKRDSSKKMSMGKKILGDLNLKPISDDFFI